jgi:hypothetical protein
MMTVFRFERRHQRPGIGLWSVVSVVSVACGLWSVDRCFLQQASLASLPLCLSASLPFRPRLIAALRSEAQVKGKRRGFCCSGDMQQLGQERRRVGLEGLGGLGVAGAGIAWATQRPRNDELQAQRPQWPTERKFNERFLPPLGARPSQTSLKGARVALSSVR